MSAILSTFSFVLALATQPVSNIVPSSVGAMASQSAMPVILGNTTTVSAPQDVPSVFPIPPGSVGGPLVWSKPQIPDSQGSCIDCNTCMVGLKIWTFGTCCCVVDRKLALAHVSTKMQELQSFLRDFGQLDGETVVEPGHTTLAASMASQKPLPKDEL